MIKPSDKVLIGWLTLLATFVSANLGCVSASELSPNTEPSANTPDLASTEQLDVVESAVAANAQSITPEAETAQPEFSSPPTSEVTPSEVTPSEVAVETLSSDLEAEAAPVAPVADKAERLEHLVATARSTNAVTSQTVTPQISDRSAQLAHLVATSTREIPQTSSFVDRPVTPATEPVASVRDPVETTAAENSADVSSITPQPVVENQLGSHQAINIPIEALPTTQVITPNAPVAEPDTGPVAAVERPQAVAPERSQQMSETVAAAPERPQQAAITPRPQVSNQPINIPVEALPTTRVMSPGVRERLARVNRNPVVNRRAPNSQVLSVQAAEKVKRTPTPTALASQTIPDEAMPRSVVMRPGAAPAAQTADVAQLPLEPPLSNSSNQDEVDRFIRDLDQVDAPVSRSYRSAPSITISNPSGFGADNFVGYVGFGYQERTRFDNKDDGGMVVGIGLGDARENIGVQLSYTVASFGGSREFGTGGFNAKLHRRLADEWSVALGWEGFATTGFVDFEDSIYGSVSHLIRTRENITQPFSRVAVTAGVGNGRIRTEDAVFDDRDEHNVFGSMAVRVAEPVSAIVEWTGQDLAAGVSITPFRDIPIVLLPAVRDITGGGDGARFVMGAGVSFQL
ncbi:MAG: hypothetical protein ACFB14_20015 [Leptolyngbyaceae cyanobacterium]